MSRLNIRQEGWKLGEFQCSMANLYINILHIKIAKRWLIDKNSCKTKIKINDGEVKGTKFSYIKVFLKKTF